MNELIYRVRSPSGQLLEKEYASESDIPEMLLDSDCHNILRDDCRIEQHPSKKRRTTP